MPWPQSDKHACGHLKADKPYCTLCHRERAKLYKRPDMNAPIYSSLARKAWR